MPFNKRLRFDDDQSLAPIEEARQHDHPESGEFRPASRLRLALQKQGELAPKKEILGDQCGAR